MTVPDEEVRRNRVEKTKRSCQMQSLIVRYLWYMLIAFLCTQFDVPSCSGLSESGPVPPKRVIEVIDHDSMNSSHGFAFSPCAAIDICIKYLGKRSLPWLSCFSYERLQGLLMTSGETL